MAGSPPDPGHVLVGHVRDDRGYADPGSFDGRSDLVDLESGGCNDQEAHAGCNTVPRELPEPGRGMLEQHDGQMPATRCGCFDHIGERVLDALAIRRGLGTGWSGSDVGWRSSGQHRPQWGHVVLRCPSQRLDQPRRQDGGTSGDLCDVTESFGRPLTQLDDESPDASPTERNAYRASDLDAVGQGLGDRIPESIIDGVTGDVRYDPGGSDLLGQSAAAAAARSSATLVDSHGNWGRPKWPYAAVSW